MKQTCLLFFRVLVILVILDNQVLAQAVNKTDSLALVDIYKNTGGNNWINNTNWLKGPVNTWFGITVNNSRVTQVNLSENNLKNGLPVSIGNLTALQYLAVHDNYGLSDSLPNSICNLTALTYFDASNCRITGNIPANIGNLINLTYLNFYFNKLTGSIPNSIGNLINLETLILFSNKLSGTIPSSIGNLIKLVFLELNVNSLEGSIPSSIGNLSNIDYLSAFGNNLSGDIPISITHLSNLSYLDLSDNKLEGSISNSIGNLSALRTLILAGNKLTGAIPVSISNLTNLTELALQANNLSGSIPAGVCNLLNLTNLNLSDNQLTGEIPKHLGNLTNLTGFSLGNNKLSGAVSKSIANLTNLFALDFSFNQLSGEFTFPKSKNPCNININHNHFTESKNVMPDKFFDLLGYYLVIGYNNYTFDGIEFLAKQYVTSYYAPQANLSIHQNNDTLSVYAGGTLKNNTYKWIEINLHDTVVIVGDSVFHPSKNGRYYARITNSVATQLTLVTDTISYTKHSSKNIVIDVPSKINAIIISPNPATNILRIQGLPSSLNIKLTVVDLAGNVAISQQLKANSASSYNLSIAALKQGNYLLKIETNDGVITKQFVKE